MNRWKKTVIRSDHSTTADLATNIQCEGCQPNMTAFHAIGTLKCVSVRWHSIITFSMGGLSRPLSDSEHAIVLKRIKELSDKWLFEISSARFNRLRWFEFKICLKLKGPFVENTFDFLEDLFRVLGIGANDLQIKKKLGTLTFEDEKILCKRGTRYISFGDWVKLSRRLISADGLNYEDRPDTKPL